MSVFLSWVLCSRLKLPTLSWQTLASFQILQTLMVLSGLVQLLLVEVQLCLHLASPRGDDAIWTLNTSADTPTTVAASDLLSFSICYCLGAGNITTCFATHAEYRGNHWSFSVDFYCHKGGGGTSSQHLLCYSHLGNASVCGSSFMYAESRSTCLKILSSYALF